MALTVYFANVAKKRNSTYQATFSTSFDCVLKAPTSLDRPTFLLSSATFDYNVAKWGDKYYFIDDVVSVRAGQWEVSCILDVLATYKSDILASKQFVSYSSQSGGNWLPDTRIPALKSAIHAQNSEQLPILDNVGCYILTIIGEKACSAYVVTAYELNAIISGLATWRADEETIIKGNLADTLSSLATALIDSGSIGNAYEEAFSCIKSCVYVPFNDTLFNTVSEQICLGTYKCIDNFGAPINGNRILDYTYDTIINMTIPWHFADWRRTTNENVQMYLPLVGVVQLSSDVLANTTQIAVKVSATPTTGSIAYELSTIGSGNTPSVEIGTYGGSCALQIPLGMAQQSSLGDRATSIAGGVTKTIASGIGSAFAGAKVGAMFGGGAVGALVGGVAGTALASTTSAYQIADTALTSNPSSVGGFTGGAGCELSMYLRCETIAHDTVVTPESMKDTMGVPTMSPMYLSSLTGYCECSNAHVSAPAQANELDAIDTYLNNGFYIE